MFRPRSGWTTTIAVTATAATAFLVTGSVIVAAVAVDALGAENVRCVMLPSEYTSAASLEDAGAVAGLLGCRLDRRCRAVGLTEISAR